MYICYDLLSFVQKVKRGNHMFFQNYTSNYYLYILKDIRNILTFKNKLKIFSLYSQFVVNTPVSIKCEIEENSSPRCIRDLKTRMFYMS